MTDAVTKARELNDVVEMLFHLLGALVEENASTKDVFDSCALRIHSQALVDHGNNRTVDVYVSL